MKKVKVVSDSRKLLFKVSDGPTVCFPDGVTPNEWGANNEEPKIVVYNATDGTWQGAGAGDYVIVNEVPGEISGKALEIYECSGGNQGILAALYYLNAEGCNDQYTTTQEFVDSKLSPAGKVLQDASGIYKRDDRDIVEAWKDEKGKYWVTPDGEARLIQEDILLRTYKHLDGSSLSKEDFE